MARVRSHNQMLKVQYLEHCKEVSLIVFLVFTHRDDIKFFLLNTKISFIFREGFKKSKWKFKMAFAMKGGGGSRGGLECHLPILKNDFLKNHLESFPDCENVFCT